MSRKTQEQHQQQPLPPLRTTPFYKYEVTTGSLSEYTRYNYTNHINDFLSHFKITDIEPLKEYSPKVLKQMVKDYILHLRDNRKLARKSINVHLAAISHFVYMIRDDDYKIDWKKVRLEIPPDENIRKDRAYTLEEIQKMLTRGCSGRLREKAIVLLLTSTGMRIGGIHPLKYGDLTPKITPQGKVYQIEVYSGSSASYYCYCNVETTKVLDEYLKERTDAGEILRTNSPLIRDLNMLNVKNVKPLSVHGIRYIVVRIVEKSGIRNTFQFTGEATYSKGFRKWYKTQAEESGMRPIHVEKTHGHSIGISSHYYRPAESDILEDYMTHAADALTILEESRLKKQIEQQDFRHSEEWQALKKEMNELKQLLNPVHPGIPANNDKTRETWWKRYKAQHKERGWDISDWPDKPPRHPDDDKDNDDK